MRRELAARPRTWLRQVTGFVRREVTEVLHQPRLLALLVFAPFAILLLFGAGYRNERLVLKALFVAPSQGVVADSLERYQQQVSEFIDVRGLTPDLIDARRQLVDDEVDILVVFPTDPADRLLRNERVPISVIHDKLDPIQQVAIDFAVRLAIDEVNAAVLATAVRDVQAALPVDAAEGAVRGAADDARAAADRGDQAQVDAAVEELGTEWAALEAGIRLPLLAVEGVAGAGSVPGTGLPGHVGDTLAQVDAEVAAARTGGLAERRAHLATVSTLLGQLGDQLHAVAGVQSEVLVQPFVGETFTATPEPVELIDFFAPAAVVLLLQHLGVTLGALSLVRDRTLGLFEVYRVGPVSPLQVLAGKFLPYVLIGGVVGAALVALSRFGLGVPLAGGVGWLAIVIAAVVAASVAVGLLVSMIAPTDAQAVQYAMIVLLASLFLGGFFLDIDRLSYPVKAISLLLPLTYGIRAVHDVMLRGIEPDWKDVAALLGLTIVYGTLATLRFRRTLRVV